MAVDVVGLVRHVFEYASILPSRIVTGDVFAVSIVLIVFYLIVLIVNKLTGLIIFLLKKLVLLVIVVLAFYQFLLEFMAKIGAEGFTNDNITLGMVGFLAGFIAIIIALYAAFSSLKKVRLTQPVTTARETPAPAAQPAEAAGGLTEELKLRQLLSLQSLKSDRNLGAVLSYVVVAEFGVFSSKTISAPTEIVGIGFFTAFMIAALFFIRQSYQNYKRGLLHLTIACIVGGTLSILLGHFWGNYPLNQLLSLGYFKTDSLVAFITGIAVSLFMGSKG
jgi:hypothetical protein